MPPWWRRLRSRFGISAPRMAVRTHLAWPWRAGVTLGLAALIVGMWWWGFDFGQILGGLNIRETKEQLARVEGEAARLRSETSDLRAKASRLESELAMAQGAQATLEKQVNELAAENNELKDEAVFLKRLVADSSKQPGLSIQRLAAERIGEDAVRYRMIVVRAGNPAGDFQGHLALAVTLLPSPRDGLALRPVVTTVPDDQPETAASLKLNFKYYQRVEGSFRVPAGAALRSMTVRAFESGHPGPRATQTLNFP